MPMASTRGQCRWRSGERDGTDLREEGALEHLRAVGGAGLGGGIVLTGLVDGMATGERRQLLDLLCDRLAPDGTLVLHSLSPSGWASPEAPPEADLSPGRPLRPVHLAPPAWPRSASRPPSPKGPRGATTW